MERVVEARKAGLTITQIAERNGVSYAVICADIGKARRAGLLPPRPVADSRSKLETKVKAMGLVRGHIGDMLLDLSLEERDWVFDAVTSDGYETIAEYLTDLVRTAYDEAQEEKKRDQETD